MPQFLEPNAYELNDLRAAKKRVLKDWKKQYKGSETTAGLVGDIQDKYNYLYEKMVLINTSLAELTNQLTLGHSSPSGYGSKAIDRYVSVVGNIAREAKLLLNYMYQQVPSLSIFSTEQQQSISGLNDQMVSAIGAIDTLSTQFFADKPNVLQRFREVVGTIKGDLMRIQQRLEGEGTGSVGELFAPLVMNPPARQSRRQSGYAPEGESEVESPPPKKKGRPKKVSTPATPMEGMGYRVPDMYGEGYRTAITSGGAYLPTRFL